MENGVAAMENIIAVLRKIKIELSYDPAIPPLGIFPIEMKAGIQTGIYIPMFTAIVRR